MPTKAYVKCFIIDYPQQLATRLALHQQVADELGDDDLGGAAEEGVVEVLGGRGAYWSGLVGQVEVIEGEWLGACTKKIQDKQERPKCVVRFSETKSSQ